MRPQSFIVSRAEAGRDLATLLRDRLKLPRGDLQRLVRAGVVRVAGKPCADLSRRLRAGARIEVRPAPRDGAGPGDRKPKRGRERERTAAGDGLGTSAIRYADEHLVVVDKPPGLTTSRHPDEAAEFGERAQRFLPPTLADRLPVLLAAREGGRPRRVIPVHRLDNETSGLVVFARTPEAARRLGAQFRAHTVERLYRAVVRGRANDARIASRLVRDRGDGRRGSTDRPGEGVPAVTHVRVLEPLGDYTLVECRLETGRTHQVRIHLGEAGTPLCGERVYDRPLHGRPLPDDSGMKRVALHAAVLGFDHPATGQRMRWTAPLPRDMADLVKRLRRSAGPHP